MQAIFKCLPTSVLKNILFIALSKGLILKFLFENWHNCIHNFTKTMNLYLSSSQLSYMDWVKVRVLHPVQQPGSYWDGSLALPHGGLKPTQK